MMSDQQRGEINPLLASIDNETWRASLEDRDFMILDYHQDCVVHLDTDPCNKLEIILEGEVAIERVDEHGCSLLVERFGPGCVLGGNLMFSDKPFYLMTVTTLRPTKMLAIGIDALFRLLSTNPGFLRAYLRLTADRTALLGERIKQGVRTSLRARLIGFLQREQKRQGGDTIVLGKSKTDLAYYLAVERTSLSRELAKMSKEGLLEVCGRTIRLHKPFKSELGW